MKGIRSILTGLASITASIALAPPAAGQDIISAMAGFVHFAEGRVLLDGEPIVFNEAQLLHAGSGQRVRTADGWVELMLMPGSFVRLAPHSELEMIQAGMLSAHMRLLTGAGAIDLASAADTSGIVMEVAGARVSFAKGGSYRLDAPGAGDTRVRSIRGHARVEWRGHRHKVGQGRQLTIPPKEAKFETRRFDKSGQDALDRWDRERREFLAEMAREQRRQRAPGSDPLESSQVYRCRVLQRGCPAYNFSGSQGRLAPLFLKPFSHPKAGAR